MISGANEVEYVTYCPTYHLGSFISYTVYPPDLIVYFSAPEFIERMNRGPVALITVRRPGPPRMGQTLALWFGLSLLLLLSVFVVFLYAGYHVSQHRDFQGASTVWDAVADVFRDLIALERSLADQAERIAQALVADAAAMAHRLDKDTSGVMVVAILVDLLQLGFEQRLPLEQLHQRLVCRGRARLGFLQVGVARLGAVLPLLGCRTADTIAVVVEQGPFRDLVRQNGTFARMWSLQSDSFTDEKMRTANSA